MTKHKIYYHDTDAGGVVYYGRYLNFLEEARTEWLVKRDVDLTEWHEKGYMFAVHECHLKYKKPARYGDEIAVTVDYEELTAAKIILKQQILNVKTGDVLVEAKVSLVCIGPGFKPTKIPHEIREKL